MTSYDIKYVMLSNGGHLESAIMDFRPRKPHKLTMKKLPEESYNFH